MLHRTIAASLSVLLVCVPAVPASPQAHESELSLGIRLAREGEFDQAVITLDTVARRLEGQAGSAQDLARAHVYLSVAHLGLGRQADARTHAERALRLDPALPVTTKEFPPRVVQLFDEARRAVPARLQNQKAPAAPTAAATPPTANPPANAPPPQATGPAPSKPTSASSAAPPEKGGGSKALWIGLGLAAAGGGVALAAGGSGGGGGGGAPAAAPAQGNPLLSSGALNGRWNSSSSGADGLREVFMINQVGTSLSGNSFFENAQGGSASHGQSSLDGVVSPPANVTITLRRTDGTGTSHTFNGTVNAQLTSITGSFAGDPRTVTYARQ